MAWSEDDVKYLRSFRDNLDSDNIKLKQQIKQKLLSDKDNEVRIALLVSPDGDLDSDQGTISFVLNPVYIGEKWYLTLRDQYAEGVGLYH